MRQGMLTDYGQVQPVRIGVALWNVGDQGPAGFDVAAAAGLDYVEIDMGGQRRGPDLANSEAVAAMAAASCRSRLPIMALAINHINDLGLTAHDGTREAEQLALVIERAAEVAHRLQVPRIIIPGFRRSLIRSPTHVRRTAEVLRSAFDRLQVGGIGMSYESELDAQGTLDLLHAVARPGITIQFDTGNPAFCGHNAASMWPSLATVAALQIHVKDAPGPADGDDIPLGYGRADIRQVFAAFVRYAKPAAYTLEGNYRQDPYNRIQRDLLHLKTMLAEAAAGEEAE